METTTDRWFAAALVVGVGARLLLVFTTVGTSDVLFMVYYANIVQKFGILEAYGYGEFINHPPLSILLMSWYDSVAAAVGLEYPHVYRFVQSVADAVTAIAVWHLGYGAMSRWAAAAFLLSPAAIFVSGFHCNTDPMLLALMMLALLAARKERYILSGCLIGAAFGIKIVALFVVPLLFLTAGKHRFRFLAGFAAVSSAIFVPVALIGGRAMITNVFGYGGWAGGWGIPGIARSIHHRVADGPETTLWLAFSDAYFHFGKYLLVALLIIFYAAFHRWLKSHGAFDLLVAAVPAVYLIVLAAAPAFGVQYLVWPLPLLPFVLSRTQYLITSAVFSVYLFAVYTVWSGGFPWWFADATADRPVKWVLTDSGFVVWLWVVAAALLALRHIRGGAKYALDSSLSSAHSA